MKKYFMSLVFILPYFAFSQSNDSFLKDYKEKGDKCFKKGDYDCAKFNYQNALFINRGDTYCIQKLEEITLKIRDYSIFGNKKREIIKKPTNEGGYIEGEFVIGELTGIGKVKFGNGDEYNGEFLKGKRTGNGKYQWANGNVYEGSFLDNQLTGKGRFNYIDGPMVYEGDFLFGFREGFGRLKIESGVITHWLDNCVLCVEYNGNWKNDKKQGFGRCYNQQGKLLYEGLFEDDKPVSKYPMN